jgi:hypothetical protein
MKKITLLILAISFQLQAQSLEDVVNASNKFLESLDNEQLKTAQFTFENKDRTSWTNLPIGLKPRDGVRIGDISASSKTALHRLLTTVLSSQGYLKVTSIMSLDDILNIIYQKRFDDGAINESQHQRMKDLDWETDNFFVSFWGKPNVKEPWAFKIGGHHLGLHLTAANNDFSMTPLFLGTDPSEVLTTEYAGLRVLSKEEDYGFLLMNSLNDAQKSKAILNEKTPGDIITGPDRAQMIEGYSGIKASELNDNQKEILQIIIKEYLNNLAYDKAKEAYNEIITAGFDYVHFAWIGSLVPRVNHYYVINGPTFLIEYDNAGFQNDGNHIHSIYREKGNDFGEDILKTHYLEHKH